MTELDPDEYERARLAVLGIDLDHAGRFPCVIHADCAASVYESVRGEYVCYACEQISPERNFGLAEVRAAQAGRDRIRAIEAARWSERLNYEAGIDAPDDVEVAVPDGASPAAVAVADGIRLFVGLRDERWYGQPFVFARQFAAAWCGIRPDDVKQGMKELRKAGAIVPAGKQGKPPREATLWRLP